MKPFRNGRHIPRRQRSLGRKFTWVECLKSALKRVVNCLKGDKLRTFKGRTVFQGNNVRDENADATLFSVSELGSSPATMKAGKAVDAYGSQPGGMAIALLESTKFGQFFEEAQSHSASLSWVYATVEGQAVSIFDEITDVGDK